MITRISKSMSRRMLLSALCVLLASSINYACANVLNIFWELHILYYVIIIFGISLMIGILLPDLKISIICSYGSMVLGAAISFLTVSRPLVIQSPEMVDLIVTLFLSVIAKLLFVSFTIVLFGVLVGYFLGERIDYTKLY